MSEQILKDFTENQGQYLTIKQLINNNLLTKEMYNLNQKDFDDFYN